MPEMGTFTIAISRRLTSTENLSDRDAAETLGRQLAALAAAGEWWDTTAEIVISRQVTITGRFSDKTAAEAFGQQLATLITSQAPAGDGGNWDTIVEAAPVGGVKGGC